MRLVVLGLFSILLSACSFFNGGSSDQQIQEAYYVPVIQSDKYNSSQGAVQPLQITDKKSVSGQRYVPVIRE